MWKYLKISLIVAVTSGFKTEDADSVDDTKGRVISSPGGFEGSDYMNAGAGEDDVRGGVGNDELEGGAGNDILHGNEGDDILDGDAGQDTYIIRSGDMYAPHEDAANQVVTGTGCALSTVVIHEEDGNNVVSYSVAATWCDQLPENTMYISVEMGVVTDYFRPPSGGNICDMLKTTSSEIEWTSDPSDDNSWRQPTPYNHHMGGSAHTWPSHNVQGDSREWLSFWGIGSGSALGGCCKPDYAAGGESWGQPFTLRAHSDPLVCSIDVESVASDSTRVEAMTSILSNGQLPLSASSEELQAALGSYSCERAKTGIDEAIQRLTTLRTNLCGSDD